MHAMYTFTVSGLRQKQEHYLTNLSGTGISNGRAMGHKKAQQIESLRIKEEMKKNTYSEREK